MRFDAAWCGFRMRCGVCSVLFGAVSRDFLRIGVCGMLRFGAVQFCAVASGVLSGDFDRRGAVRFDTG